MSFAWPAALLSLALIPVLMLAYVLVQRRRVKYAMRFTNLDLLANVVDRSPGWRRHLPPLFALVALAALLVALARPQTTIAVPRDEASVVLAIDVSGSMMATDVPPTRLAAAKESASAFVEGLPERFGVGLVSFSTGATALAEPSDDREEILDLVDGLEAHTGTAIGDAIAAALDLAPGRTRKARRRPTRTASRSSRSSSSRMGRARRASPRTTRLVSRRRPGSPSTRSPSAPTRAR